MKLNRNEAIEILAYRSLIKLRIEEREDVLFEIISYSTDLKESNDYSDPLYNASLIDYFKDDYMGVKNEYLSKELLLLFQKEIIIIGESENLFPCPCCNYKTLQLRYEYDICKVCFWEDDGTKDDFSGPNKMTLITAKSNFDKIGAISTEMLQHVDVNGKEKYDKNQVKN